MNARAPHAPAAKPVAAAGWSHTDACIEAGRHTLSMRLHRYRRADAGDDLRLDTLRVQLSDSRWLPSPMVRSCRLSSLALEVEGDALWLTNRSRLRLAMTRDGLSDLVAPAGTGTLGLLGARPVTAAAARNRVRRINKALTGCTRTVQLAWLRDPTGLPFLLRVGGPAPLQPRFYRTVAQLARTPGLADTVVKSVDVDATRCLLVLSAAHTPTKERDRILLDRFSAIPGA